MKKQLGIGKILDWDMMGGCRNRGARKCRIRVNRCCRSRDIGGRSIGSRGGQDCWDEDGDGEKWEEKKEGFGEGKHYSKQNMKYGKFDKEGC